MKIARGFLTFLLLAGLAARGVVISEFLASNKEGLKDSFGENSDWIELYNDGETFSLKGYGLSDSAKDPLKWTFPDTNFVAGTFLLVRASDRDLAVPGQELHTNFKLSTGGEYLGISDPEGHPLHEYAPKFPMQYDDISYGLSCHGSPTCTVLRETNSFCRVLVPTGDAEEGTWYRPDFDDSAWRSGQGGVGYEKSPGAVDFRPFIGLDTEAEMYDRNGTAYIRMPFETGSLGTISRLVLRMLYDDGFVCYLNGSEVARVNAPATVSWDSCSPTFHYEYDTIIFEDVDISASSGLLRSGSNLLCIHGLNDKASSSDFLMDAELVLDGVSSLVFGKAGYFDEPTPGALNGENYDARLQPVVISEDSGFMEEPFSLEITSPDEGAEIRYTLDATQPSLTHGEVYSGPIQIQETTVLRAGAFKSGAYSPRPQARTYVFIDDVIAQPDGARPGPQWPSGTVNGQRFDYGMDREVTEAAAYADLMPEAFRQIPMLSLVVSPGNLFSTSTGIYVHAGQDGRTWERYAQAIYMRHDGQPGFNVGCGLRIRGANSRSGSNRKHSFRLFFRGEYGDSKLKYPLFGDEGASSFDKVDLRTAQNFSWSLEGGNDPRENIMCRDVFARDMQREMGEPYTRSRYFHLLLNGHYWGLYQYQERAEECFAATYFGGDKDDYDVIKPDGYSATVNHGTIDAWKALWTLAKNGFDETSYNRAVGRDAMGHRDPSLPVLLDPTNLADYTIINNFIANCDGPLTLSDSGPNNFFSVYCHARPAGFKFFCHDSEHAMVKSYLTKDKTGTISTGSSGTGAFNPRYLHQRLCAVEAYRRVFQSRVSRHYFNGGVATPEAATALLMSRAAEIDKAIICESARWGDVREDYKSYEPFTRDGHWYPELRWVTGTFFQTRHSLTLAQYASRGWYPASVTPPVITPNGGAVAPGTCVSIAGQHAMRYTTDGSDPLGSPTASYYSGPIVVAKPMVLRCAYDLASCDYPLDVTAEFTISRPSPLIISEIMYMPADPEPGSAYSAKDFEFLEFFNTSHQLYYPEGQTVTGGVTFAFAKGAPPIPGLGYAVAVRNLAAFAERYETNGLYIAGEFSGSLSNDGEFLGLSNYGLTYNGVWYDGARGLGPSIVVSSNTLPKESYSTRSGWRVSGEPYGSPGREDVPEPACLLLTLLLLALGGRRL